MTERKTKDDYESWYRITVNGGPLLLRTPLSCVAIELGTRLARQLKLPIIIERKTKKYWMISPDGTVQSHPERYT